MPKKKLRRFAEVDVFPNCVFMSFEDAKQDIFRLKGKWNSDHFKDAKPIVLELACGKGEYTVGLGRNSPEMNFTGVDIKGNRIWKGAKMALDESLTNIAFLRTRIDFIHKAFGPNEVSEIWITFPDPQPKKENKRLTSPFFLSLYRAILQPGGTIHLKTDSDELFEYTLKVIRDEKLTLLDQTSDLYNESTPERKSAASLQTYYEGIYLEKGKNINYLRFTL